MSELPEYLTAATEAITQGDFEVVVFGRTHLPKQISIGSVGDPRCYFNSGAWCDVMRLPESVTKDFHTARAPLQEFVRAIRNNDFRQYTYRYLSFVEIDVDPEKKENSVRKARLYSYGCSGQERSPPLTNLLDIQRVQSP